MREVLIPEIEKEVNQGEAFANLRQIYNSVILATWYKQNLKDSLLGQVYVGKNKTAGVDTQNKQVNQEIYGQYLEAFKKGVYNYIREDYAPATQEIIPRKYFSGGTSFDNVDKLLTKYKSGVPLDRQEQEVVRYFLTQDPAYNGEKKVNVNLVEVAEGKKAEDVAEIAKPIKTSSPVEQEKLKAGLRRFYDSTRHYEFEESFKRISTQLRKKSRDEQIAWEEAMRSFQSFDGHNFKISFGLTIIEELLKKSPEEIKRFVDSQALEYLKALTGIFRATRTAPSYPYDAYGVFDSSHTEDANIAMNLKANARSLVSHMMANRNVEKAVKQLLSEWQTKNASEVRESVSEIFGSYAEERQVTSSDNFHLFITEYWYEYDIDLDSPVIKKFLERKKVGGINLNPELFDLQIRRDGNGVPLPINMQPIHQMRIDGFVPVIINVTPVVNLPLLLGFADRESPVNSADADSQTTSFDLSFADKYRNKYIRGYEYQDDNIDV